MSNFKLRLKTSRAIHFSLGGAIIAATALLLGFPRLSELNLFRWFIIPLLLIGWISILFATRRNLFCKPERKGENFLQIHSQTDKTA